MNKERLIIFSIWASFVVATIYAFKIQNASAFEACVVFLLGGIASQVQYVLFILKRGGFTATLSISDLPQAQEDTDE